jgi:hypothetical protein
MTITKRSDHDSKQLAGDDQLMLVQKIQLLAYRINQASLADVFVNQAPTTLHVRVQPYYQNTPKIDRTLGLSTGPVAGVTIGMLLVRLRNVANELQGILDKGLGPKGEIA